MHTAETTRNLVLAFYEQLWNAWDDSAVESVLAERFEFRGSLGATTHGRDGWRKYRDGIRSSVPDFHNTIRTLIVEEGRAAARLRYTGTHRGSFAGVPATDRPFEYAGAAFFTAAGGRLDSAWVLGDLAGLRESLGGDR